MTFADKLWSVKRDWPQFFQVKKQIEIRTIRSNDAHRFEVGSTEPASSFNRQKKQGHLKVELVKISDYGASHMVLVELESMPL